MKRRVEADAATQAEATYRQLTAAAVAAEAAWTTNPCRETSAAHKEADFRACDAYWAWQTVWNITIGHVTLEPGTDEDPPYVTVPVVTLAEAPDCPGDPTGRTNLRRPGYAGWRAFTDAVGLTDFFFGPAGVMNANGDTSAGLTRLTRAHLAYVRAARVLWEEAHPGCVPGWFGDGAAPIAAYHLARLVWLEWWMAWALATDEGAALEYG